MKKNYTLIALTISLFLLSGCTSAKLNSITKKQQILKEDRTTHFQVLSPEKQCYNAGYTEEQMIDVNFDCMKLEDLKPYMSSNTYYNIKLGDSIENYKFLKRPKDSYEKNRILYRIPVLSYSSNGEYNGDLYFSEDNTTTTTVLTRFGLIDTIIVDLGVVGSTPEKEILNREDVNIAETKVLNTLKSKYSLFLSNETIEFNNFWNNGKGNSLFNGTKYMGFKVESKRLWHFKNGEDNILYILDGSYRSTVIYTSNAYNMIDIISKEKKEEEKSNLNQNENSKLNRL